MVQAQFRGPHLSDALKEEEPDIDEERPQSLTDIMAARVSNITFFNKNTEFHLKYLKIYNLCII